MDFMQFTLTLLQIEVNNRQSKDETKRLKSVGLPMSTDLGLYDAEKNGLKTGESGAIKKT